MELDWFLAEVAERTKWCDFTPLVTTCTDGENGGWFRNVTEGANFWSAFYLPLLERVAAGEAAIAPTFISCYLDNYGAHGEVRVRTGAWNTGWHHGRDFTQWTGSDRQKQAIDAFAKASRMVHDARWYATERGVSEGPEAEAIEEAMWRLLRAETSCHLYWGEAWVPRAEADLEASLAALERVGIRPEPTDTDTPAPAPAPASDTTPASAADVTDIRTETAANAPPTTHAPDPPVAFETPAPRVS